MEVTKLGKGIRVKIKGIGESPKEQTAVNNLIKQELIYVKKLQELKKNRETAISD